MHILPEFEPYLDAFDLQALEHEAGSVYGLYEDGRLAMYNQAWVDFALANGGANYTLAADTLGLSVFDALKGPLRDHFIARCQEVLSHQRVWTHRYECSSAEIYRVFHMSIYPLKRPRVCMRGLLLVNSLVVEMPHDPEQRPICEPLLERYETSESLVVQCSHCRRVRRAMERSWDWVPDLVKFCPENVSHGLCEVCLDYYYPP